MKNIFKDLQRKDHKRYLGGLDVFRYIGPGLLVTVGFIDPGNWASNFAAGVGFGSPLLWGVAAPSGLVVILPNKVAHPGLCLLYTTDAADEKRGVEVVGGRDH